MPRLLLAAPFLLVLHAVAEEKPDLSNADEIGWTCVWALPEKR